MLASILSGNRIEDDNPVLLCYDDPDGVQVAEPAVWIYGPVADAKKELRSVLRCSDAIVKKK